MDIKKKRWIIGISMSVGGLLFSIFGFNALAFQKNNSIKYQSWMKNLDDNISIRNINMPGSHDSGALYSLADFVGQCQSLSINDQLNLGVRFLDIRLKITENKLHVVHGFVDEMQLFHSVKTTVENFLNNNPSEFVIMSIKNENDKDQNNPLFEKLLKEDVESDVFLKDNEIPSKLGYVRGKAMILARYANNTIGVPAFNGWADSASFTLPNDIYVQDTYKITSSKQKEDEIIKCFNESGHALKINFLSAYRTNSFPPMYSVSAALDINPWINEEISKYNDRGIVLYDFVNKENMDKFFEGLL